MTFHDKYSSDEFPKIGLSVSFCATKMTVSTIQSDNATSIINNGTGNTFTCWSSILKDASDCDRMTLGSKRERIPQEFIAYSIELMGNDSFITEMSAIF